MQEYDTRKTKYSLQKEDNLIKQKYMTYENTAQNIQTELSPALKMRRQKNTIGNQPMENSTRTLKDLQQKKKNPWRGYVAQAYREK